MKTKLFLLALTAGTMMFTACNNNSPAANELSMNFNKVKSHIGLKADTVTNRLLGDGYSRVGASQSYIKNVSDMNYTVFLTVTDGLVEKEELTISTSKSSTFISNDENYMALLESLTEKYVLVSQDTAYFYAFSWGPGAASDFSKMVGEKRQDVMSAKFSYAQWDKDISMIGSDRKKNYVKIGREFNAEDRSTGGKFYIEYRNNALISL